MRSFLLDKIRPFLHLDRRIYIGVTSLMALRGLQMILSFITMYVLTRSLTKNDFGEYQFVLSVAGAMTIFSLTGMADAVMQARTRKEPGIYEKARDLSFMTGILGSVFILGAAAWFWYRKEDNLAAGLVITAFLFPLANALTLWKNILAGDQRFPKLAQLEAVNALGLTGLVIAVCSLWPGSFLLPLVLVLAVPALQNLNQTFFAQRAAYLPFRLRWRWPEISRDPYLFYGLKMSAYGLIGTVGMYLDRILLFFFLSPTALATFVVAEKITSLCSTAVKDVAAILAPRLAHHPYYTRRLDQAFTIFSIVFGLGVLFVAIFVVPFMIPLLFGPKYAESILYAQVLVASVALGNIAVLKIRFIQSRLDDASVRRINLYTSGLRVGASLILVPTLGLWGAVLSGYIFRIGTTLLVNREVRRHTEPPEPTALPPMPDVPYVGPPSDD